MEIEEILEEEGKIAAIKAYRDRHFCGLKEAKDIVDSMASDEPTSYAEPEDVQPAYPGRVRRRHPQ